MAYAKKWVPPTIPLRNNLPAWKLLFTDLHDNLIAAGLVQTDTGGQLDIDGVAALPEDGSFAGFREYAFNDALQAEAPVILRVYFGCGGEGLNAAASAGIRTRTPRTGALVYFKGKLVFDYYSPQTINLASGAANTQLTTQGFSALSYAPEYGFFGITYGAGSRNKPFANVAGSYYGASMSCFIQRTLDELGQPTAQGLMCYGPALTNALVTASLWEVGTLSAAVSGWIPNSGEPVVRRDMAPRVGRQELASGVDSLLLEPIYAPSNPPRPFPFLFSYYHTTIGEASEFEFSPLIGGPQNFIALGRETSIAVDAVDAQRAGLAMLFKND